MPVALLCVQFRNLLPSEELLMLARTLWQDAHRYRPGFASGDATLSITHAPGARPSFQAELTIEGSPASTLGAGPTARGAVGEAFRQLALQHAPSALLTVRPLGNLAPAG